MDCELCGKELRRVRKIKTEGSILSVCDDCVRYGEEVQFSVPQPVSKSSKSVSAPKFSQPQSQPSYSDEPGELELVENYSELIRNVWNRSGKKKDEFAQMLNEKESVINKLMSGSMVPDDKLIKKLEQKLGLKLREPASI
ncbi:MAG: multiprotein bridging factor aMBF1 [archaeon]